MRLIQLNLHGIGPFADEFSIDFATVGETGLFLLEGPTGSGKSTIIDAIVYALYGQVAASSSELARITSDHLAPGQQPYVDLIFELESGIYRLTRTPKYERAKKHGTGNTSENATARLWRVPQLVNAPTSRGEDILGAEIIVSHASDVGPEVTKILGLTHIQFMQTVVLPQGEFATFLHSTSIERCNLLQRIFGTEHFANMEKEFIERGKLSASDVKEAQSLIAEKTNFLITTAGVSQVTAEELRLSVEQLDAEKLAERYRAALCELSDAADLESRKANAALTELKTAQVAQQSAISRGETDMTWQKAEGTRIRLAERKADVERARVGIVVARKAAVANVGVHTRDEAVQASERARSQCVAQLEQASQDGYVNLGISESMTVESLWARLEEPGTTASQEGRGQVTNAHRAVASLAKAEHDLTKRIGGRKYLLNLERGLPERLKALQTRQEFLVGLSQQKAAATVEIETQRELQTLKLEQIDTLAEQAEQQPGAQEARIAAEAVLDQVQRRDKLASQVAKCTVSCQKALQAAEKAGQHYQEMQQRRMQGIAGELAESLTDGNSCLVCGSTSHPLKAQKTPNDVTAVQVQNAHEKVNISYGDAESSRKELERLTTEHTALAASIGERTVLEATESVVAATKAVERIVAAATQLKRERAQALKLHSQLEQKLANLQELSEQLASGAASNEQLQLEITRDQALLSEIESVAELQQKDEHELAACQQLREAFQARSEAVELLSRAQNSVGRLLKQNDFKNETDLRKATWESAYLSEQEALLTAYDAAIAANRATLSDAKVAAFALEMSKAEDPEVIAVHIAEQVALTGENVAQREASHTQMAGAAATSGKTFQDSTAAAAAIESAMTEHSRVLEKAKPALRLKALAEAGMGNEKRITLSTYVLLHRFDRVLDAANSRLSGMLNGRYQLQRSEEKEGSSRTIKLGLGVAVLDNETDKPRAPKTLSGGETFCVSLALALGLADTVSEESGGIRLETLFIDEGFGSLDPGSLEQVQMQLDRLRDGGRCVGVVSHVEDMKQAIAEKISVRRNSNGTSRVETVAKLRVAHVGDGG